MTAPSPKRHIRQARLSDLDTLVAFNAALARETEGRQLDAQRLRLGTTALLNDPRHGRYLVVEEDAGPTPSIIAQLMMTYEWSDWRNGVFWWIQSVYVHPDRRRQGVFRQLYDYVRQEAHSQPDVVGIRLYVEQDNTTAQGTYHSLGLARTPYLVFEEDFILGTAEESEGRNEGPGDRG